MARNYDGTEYQLNLADARLVLVNGNLPLDAEPAPALAVADDATGQQLEAEAAEQYRAMAAAAAADGITLELVTGYQDVSAREAAFDAQKQVYLEKGLSEEEAAAYAACVCLRPMPASRPPAMRRTFSARTAPKRPPALPIPAPTSG